ncbi:MAG: radical SAM protein [Candidatus Gracilibacteria bacterium]|nr:radical SAM protein [Candidatus Gracilibacteria bacterium]
MVANSNAVAKDRNDLIQDINGFAGYDIASKMGIEKYQDHVLENIRSLMSKKTIFSNEAEYAELLNKEGLKVEINLGNNCFHKCLHCLHGHDNLGADLDFEQSLIVLRKYSSRLKHVKEVIFTGGELMDMKNFPLFIEELAKKGIRKISFVTRGGVVRNDSNSAELLKLKERFPDLDLSFSISLDQYSSVYNANDILKIENIASLIDLSFKLGNQSIYFKSALPSKDKQEMEEHIYFNQIDFEEILSALKKQFNFIVSKEQNGIFILKKDGKEILLHRTKHRLKGYTENAAKMKGVSLEMDCEHLFYDNHFKMMIDPSFNILYCSYVNHGNNDQTNSIGNLLTDSRGVLMQRFFETKRRFYELLTPEKIIEYAIDPKGKILCAPLRKEIYA